MKESIIVVDADKENCRALCVLLEAQHHRVLASHSWVSLQRLIQKSRCRAVILDLDTVPVDNRSLRALKKTNPDLYLVAVSDRSFHPELKEAITTHIFACLSKPVDPDELIYWMESIFSDGCGSEDRPP